MFTSSPNLMAVVVWEEVVPSLAQSHETLVRKAALVSKSSIHVDPRGSSYLNIQELGLEDHIYYGFGDLIPCK